ncbi:hypothetical protein GCM10022243_20820 [Saccharothrix violaceirubra]
MVREANRVVVRTDDEAEVIEEVFEDTPLSFLREAVEAARAPERVPDDEDAAWWGGNYTQVTVRRADVFLENLYDFPEATLTHEEFIHLVTLYDQVKRTGEPGEWARA